MNIVVLGASSQIGSAIASAFSCDNNLVLVGRNVAKLHEAADRCLRLGAQIVREISTDLSKGSGELLAALGDGPVDLIINSSSAISRLRDKDIPVNSLADCVRVDLLAPLELVQTLLLKQGGRPLGLIFISSVLAVVSSPNRSIYSGLKSVHERWLRSLASANRRFYVLVVTVGKVIPPDVHSVAAERLARATKQAFDSRKPTLIYGWAGRSMMVLYYFQPLIFKLAVWVRRALVGKFEIPRTQV